MIRKWLLASLAGGGLVLGMVGCGEDAPQDKPKPPKPGAGTPTKPGTPEKPTTPIKPTTDVK